MAEMAIDALLQAVRKGRSEKEIIRRNGVWNDCIEKVKQHVDTSSLSDDDKLVFQRLELKNRRLVRSLKSEVEHIAQEMRAVEYAIQRLNAGRNLLV